MELIYSGDLDGEFDSKNTSRSPGSPKATKATEYEPSNEKAQSGGQFNGHYQILISTEDEHVDSPPVPVGARSPVSESDVGSHHRGGDTCGTKGSFSTTQEARECHVFASIP